jgi:hypothetical protein
MFEGEVVWVMGMGIENEELCEERGGAFMFEFRCLLMELFRLLVEM